MPKLWSEKSYTHPGEYGKCLAQAEGFAIVTHPQLSHQIYICSLNFVKILAESRKIPAHCITSMSVSSEYKEGIPEVPMLADDGLRIFRLRLAKLHNHTDEKRMIIHCRRGRNRSPVAALIYMVDRGIPYAEAYNSIMQAMQVRFPNYQLNPFGNYTESLNKLKLISEAKQHTNAGIYTHTDLIMRPSP